MPQRDCLGDVGVPMLPSQIEAFTLALLISHRADSINGYRVAVHGIVKMGVGIGVVRQCVRAACYQTAA
jgi:hypothetical protein